MAEISCFHHIAIQSNGREIVSSHYTEPSWLHLYLIRLDRSSNTYLPLQLEIILD